MFVTRVTDTILAVPAAAWDACANPAGEPHNPFLAHAFLAALENSGSVGKASGWTPKHVLIEDEAGRLVAAAPTYLKDHSLGEYVFDHGWAEAYARAGGAYYPKLQAAVPFTPATGRRLLAARDAPTGALDALIGALIATRDAHKASSIHVTFATRAEAEHLTDAGYHLRKGVQFHFLNEAYRDYDDFLDRFISRKRKAIKRERREALLGGVTIERLSGAAIEPAHWDAFFAFYMDTGARKWGRPYLTREFFDEVGQSLADRILLVMARRDGRYIAGAINFLGDDAIYGRHWGAIEPQPFLHFEVCYHQAIDYAIEHGFKRVEAGAQGEHKLSRGYRPVATYSAHAFADHRLGEAVARFLERERAAIDALIADYEMELPFRRAENPGSVVSPD